MPTSPASGVPAGHASSTLAPFDEQARLAALLQRVGRSGHRLDALIKGRLFPQSRDELVECAALLDKKLALPAYDQCIKASHCFNLLDARGVISVTERAAYIARVRALAKRCCEAWLVSQGVAV